MKILIPEEVRQKVKFLQRIQLITITSSDIINTEVNLKHAEQYNFVLLHDSLFEVAQDIKYELIFKNNKTKCVNFADKNKLIYNDTRNILTVAQTNSSDRSSGIAQWCMDALSKELVFEKNDTKNAIVVFSSKKRGYLNKKKLTYLKSIARIWKCDFIVYNKPSQLLTKKQIKEVSAIKGFRKNILNYVCKLLSVGKALDEYERVLWLDDTCVVTPFAPNLFNIVPDNTVGALVLPENIKLGEPLFDKTFLKQERNVDIKNAYCNNGVMIIPSCYKGLFELETIIQNKDLLQSPYPTQALQNYLMQLHKCSLFDITAVYNLMPCHFHYDVANWNINDMTSLYSKFMSYGIIHFTSFHKNRQKFHNEFLDCVLKVLNKKFSLIIPLKEYANLDEKTIEFYESIPCIGEIILICNFDQRFSLKEKYSKVVCIPNYINDTRHIDHITLDAIDKFTKNDNIIILKGNFKMFPNYMSSMHQQFKCTKNIVADTNVYYGDKKTFKDWNESLYQFTTKFIPVLVHTNIGRTLFVRCSEGFGNQLRMYLAGDYLTRKGYISEYKQEWVIGNQNNVNYQNFFETLNSSSLGTINKKVNQKDILKAATFSGMLYHYANIIDWSSFVREQMSLLTPLEEIRKKVEELSGKFDINHLIGLHVRRTCKTSLLKNSIQDRHSLLTNKDYLNLIDNGKYFLATDNVETQKIFKRQNSSICWVDVIENGIENNIKGNYSSDKVVRFTSDLHTILDFLLLQKCKRFVGSHESSFSLLVYYSRNKREDYSLYGSL